MLYATSLVREKSRKILYAFSSFRESAAREILRRKHVGLKCSAATYQIRFQNLRDNGELK